MSKVFEPMSIQGLEFKNRIIHAPTTLNLSDPEGHATQRMAAAYGSLAQGGYSAVCVGATCVRRDGLINERMAGMYDEDYVIGFRDTVVAIQNNDALAGIQLFYGGLIPGLGATKPLDPGKGWIPNTVSWGPSNKYFIGNPKSGVIPTEVYESLVEDYAQAARRSREAGFDYVSFHFCHGSLPHVTLSLLANQGRTDKYADRFLFCEEIIMRTQELCGKDFPIIPRLVVDEFLEGGYDLKYFAEHYAPRLHALGIAALDCTFGSMLVASAPTRKGALFSTEYAGPTFYTPKVVNRENLKSLRAELIRHRVDMPLVGAGNLITPEHIRTMVDEVGADFAGVCRLSLDDPDFPNKMLQGRENEIRKSTHTGASLLQGNIFSKGMAGSAQNPAFGRDEEYRIRPSANPQRIMVIGGGSGGMEYAITAKQIGHDVTLFEATDTLGGTMDWAGNYPDLPNMEMLRYQPDYHRTMMAKHEVPVKLNTAIDFDQIKAFEPDVVVLATGARAVIPKIPGLEDARNAGFAHTIDEAMSRAEQADLGDTVVIYGAGEGAELALNLKLGGRKVRLVDPGKRYKPANYIGSRAAAIQVFMQKAGVDVESNKTLAKVENGLLLLDTPDGTEKVEASALVFCVGRERCNELLPQLRASGITVQVIGDAKKPRSYANAIHEAAYLVRQL